MKITVLSTEEEFDNFAAEKILEQMKVPGSVIGLSTGRTTGNMHRIIARRYNEHPFDISTVTFFAQDEIVGIPDTNFRACKAMLVKDLMKDIPVKPENFVTLPTDWKEYPQACEKFNKRLGQIDLLVLGLGENGHLGFNQPGTPFTLGTNVAELLPALHESVCKDANLPSDARLGGATLGLVEDMTAKKILLVAKGDNKTEIVRKIIEGPVCEDVPASILQKHQNCEYVLDSKAAAALTR